jgi:hypothetical protein
LPHAQLPSPPLTIKLIRSYPACQILAWVNVKMAALAGDWTLIQVGYHRQTAVVAARMDQNPIRRKFIEWAVDYLRVRGNEEITQIALLEAWTAIPIETRGTLLGTPRVPIPELYFQVRCGVKLTMAELRKLALEVPEISPAPSQADGAQESGGDGYIGEVGTGEAWDASSAEDDGYVWHEAAPQAGGAGAVAAAAGPAAPGAHGGASGLVAAAASTNAAGTADAADADAAPAAGVAVAARGEAAGGAAANPGPPAAQEGHGGASGPAACVETRESPRESRLERARALPPLASRNSCPRTSALRHRPAAPVCPYIRILVDCLF